MNHIPTAPMDSLLLGIRCIAPRELRLATGRLLSVLSAQPAGLSKDELLERLHPGFSTYSPARRRSLALCLDKTIQRARARFSPFGIRIVWSRSTGCFQVVIRQ